MSTEPSAAILLQTFVRVLAHRVRTPLSVILNDLSYLSSQHPPEEFERAVRRCREIAQILESIPQQVLSPANLALDEASALIIEGGSLSAHHPLEWSFRSIGDLFRSIVPECGVVKTPQGISLTPDLPTIREVTLTSLTEFVDNVLHRDVLAAPMIDALLSHYGWHIRVTTVPIPQILISSSTA
jgi:signal transduction histidine kinase